MARPGVSCKCNGIAGCPYRNFVISFLPRHRFAGSDRHRTPVPASCPAAESMPPNRRRPKGLIQISIHVDPALAALTAPSPHAGLRNPLDRPDGFPLIGSSMEALVSNYPIQSCDSLTGRIHRGAATSISRLSMEQKDWQATVSRLPVAGCGNACTRAFERNPGFCRSDRMPDIFWKANITVLEMVCNSKAEECPAPAALQALGRAWGPGSVPAEREGKQRSGRKRWFRYPCCRQATRYGRRL